MSSSFYFDSLWSCQVQLDHGEVRSGWLLMDLINQSVCQGHSSLVISWYPRLLGLKAKKFNVTIYGMETGSQLRVVLKRRRVGLGKLHDLIHLGRFMGQMKWAECGTTVKEDWCKIFWKLNPIKDLPHRKAARLARKLKTKDSSKKELYVRHPSNLEEKC